MILRAQSSATPGAVRKTTGTISIPDHMLREHGIDFLCRPANGCNIGTVSLGEDGDERITICMLRKPSAPGIAGSGLVATLSPEDARDIAAALIKLAAEIEVAAAAQADAALLKASSRAAGK